MARLHEDAGRDGGPLRGALGARRGRAAAGVTQTTSASSVVGHARRASRRPRRVSGAARYVSDIALPGMLHAAVAALARTRTPRVRARPGRRRARCRACTPCSAPRRHPRPRRPAGADRRARLRGRAGRGAGLRRRPRRPSGRSRRSRPRYEPLGFVVDLDEALADQRVHRRIRPRTSAATSRPPWPRPTRSSRPSTRTPAQVQHALEPHCAVAQWRGDELHALVSTQGICAARAASSRGRSASTPTACTSPASSWAAASAPSRAPTTGGPDRGVPARAPQPAAPCGVFNDRRSEERRRRPPRPDRSRPTASARDARRHADGDRGHLGDRHTRCAAGSYPTTIPARTLYRCANVRAHGDPAADRPRASRTRSARPASWRARSATRARSTSSPRRSRSIRSRCGAPTTSTSTRSAACPTRPSTSRPASTARPSWPAGRERDALRDREHPDGRRRGLGAACQIWWGGGGPPAHALVRMGHDGARRRVVHGRAGHRHRRHDGVRDGRRRGARPAARPRARRGRLDALRRLRAGLGRLADDARRSRRPCARPPTTCARKLLELAGDVCSRSPPTTCASSTASSCSLDGALRAARSPRSPASSARRSSSARARAARTPTACASTRSAARSRRSPSTPPPGEITVERIVAGARHRPRDLAAAGAQPGRGRRAAGARLRAHGGARRRPDDGHRREREPRGLQAADAWPTAPRSCRVRRQARPARSTLGIKGLGEPPIVPTAAAIANAVSHATGRARARRRPITPRRFLEARA